jgi:hypothetical protein
MSSQRLHGGAITLCLLLSCRLVLAVDSTVTAPPVVNPAPNGSASLSASPTPALRAMPVNSDSLGIDAGSNRRFYTLTASLREVYDSNLNTSSSGNSVSFDTDLAPSVLVNFQKDDNTFSARYSFEITYYSGGGSNNAGTNNPVANNNSLNLSHEFDAQLDHSFNDRFNLNASDLFRYFTEPSLDQNVGSAFRNGPYFSNEISAGLSSQWTPLVGTSTTLGSTVVDYQDAVVGANQNSVQDTGSESVSYAILPKISASLGGIADNITYQSGIRGYTSLTGFLGTSWAALPALSVSGRAGGSYTQTVDSQASIAPYAELSLNWTLGARSSLIFNYSHEITPSDQPGANGQSSDRVTATGSYDLTPRLTTHVEGTFTNSTVSSSLTTSQTPVSPNQIEYYLDTGLSYHYDKYIDFDFGVTFSGVTSSLPGDAYTRAEASLGIRGTY